MGMLKVPLLECWLTNCRCLLDGNIYSAKEATKTKLQMYFMIEIDLRCT